MKNEILIGSLNCKNSYQNRKLKPTVSERKPDLILEEFIQKSNFDLLGTQELTRRFTESLQKRILKYRICGKYRYGNNIFAKNLPQILDYNESNAIILKTDVISNFTVYIPWFPSFIPRIATAVVTRINEEEICMINTHLDYQQEYIQRQELKFLQYMVEDFSKQYPVILTGDFNIEQSDPLLKIFEKNIAYLGMKRVEINESTHYKYETAIDHIFIPEDWKVLDAGINKDKNLEEITDHRNVYALVKTKKVVKKSKNY